MQNKKQAHITINLFEMLNSNTHEVPLEEPNDPSDLRVHRIGRWMQKPAIARDRTVGSRLLFTILRLCCEQTHFDGRFAQERELR